MERYYKTYLLHRKLRLVDRLPWSMDVYSPPEIHVPHLLSVILAIVSIYE